MSVIVDAIQWKYSRKHDGTYPIKIRVIWRGESKYYPVLYNGARLSLTIDDWNETFDQSIKGELRKIRDEIGKQKAKAIQVMEDVTLNGKKIFSFERFEREYKQITSLSFIRIFLSHLQTLLNQGRTGTYRSYMCALVAFKAFLKGKDIQVYDITPELLSGFERYLLRERLIGKNPETARNLGKNTVAIYMRTIKVIFNVAASENPSLLEYYPFARKRNEKNRYQIRTGSGKKGDVLSLDNLRNFILTVPANSREWEAKQFWLLSFYCQGMNFRDIAMLKIKDIKGGNISYVRNKTRNTELNESKLVIPISSSINEILMHLITGRSEDDYAFSYVTKSMNPFQIERAVMKMIKATNVSLRRLCKANGLPPITTYWARHSYASQLKYNGVSVDFIQELLGHSSSRTTQTYLRRFEQDKVAIVNNEIERLVNQIPEKIDKQLEEPSIPLEKA